MFKIQHSVGAGGLEPTDASAISRVPAGVSGRSVLHVGCTDESVCLTAAEGGAARVTGVFTSTLGLDAARRRLPPGAPVTLVGGPNPLDHLPDTPFDVVVCNLLNDAPSPSALLERLATLTRQWLVLDVAGPEVSGRATAHGGRVSGPRVPRNAPWMDLAGGERTPSYPEARFYPTPAALKALVMDHRFWFDDVRFEHGREEGRFLCFARRRRLRHVVVIAGPSSSGKSTLVDHLRRGAAPPDLRTRLGLESPEDWAFVDTGRAELRALRATRAVLHYDLSRAWRRRLPMGWDKPLELLDVAERVSIVTLMAERKALVPRAWARAMRARHLVRSLERGRTAHALDAVRGLASRVRGRRDVSTTRLRALVRLAGVPGALERELNMRRRRAEAMRRNLEVAMAPELLDGLYQLWFSECRRWPCAEHVRVDAFQRVLSAGSWARDDPAGVA